MSKFQYTNSHILDADPGPIGFVLDDGKYAAIPIMGSSTKLMVIWDNCTKMKECRNLQSAKSFVDKLRQKKRK